MEFKEIWSYTKKWWWVVVALSLVFGVLSYFLYDVLPTSGSREPHYSAESRFRVTKDRVRYVSRGARQTNTVYIDQNTEMYEVQSDDNLDRAALYFFNLNDLVKQDATEDKYAQTLRSLAQTAAGVGMDSRTNADNSKLKTPEDAEKRALREQLERLTVTVGSDRGDTRIVVIEVRGAKSRQDARRWADALVLAAVAESWRRLGEGVNAIIAGEQRRLEILTSPLSNERVAQLTKLAQDRLQSSEDRSMTRNIESLHTEWAKHFGPSAEVPPPLDFNGRELDPAAVASRLAFKYDYQAPSFYGAEAVREENRYHTALTDSIRANYSDVAFDTDNNFGAYGVTATLKEALTAELSALRVLDVEATTLTNELEKKLAYEREWLAQEQERFEAAVRANELDSYSPNTSIFRSTRMVQGHQELLKLRSELAKRLERNTEAHSDVVAVKNQIALAMSEWEASIREALNDEMMKIDTREREFARRLEGNRTELGKTIQRVSMLRGKSTYYANLSTVFAESTKVIGRTMERIKESEDYISNLIRDKDGYDPVLTVYDFSDTAKVTTPADMRGPVAAVIALIVLVGSSVMIYVLMLARNKITTEYDVRRHVNLPVLAKLARRPMDEMSLLQVGPKSAAAEAYSTLSTLVRSYARELSLRSILVTSAVKSEGKTDVTCNLAISLARKGLRVLVIDCDLHRARVGNFFGVTSANGIKQFCDAEHGADILDFVIATSSEGPDILLPGGEVPDPVRLLESDAFRQLMKQAEREYDLVLFDSPPVARVGDGLILAAEVDATLLVASSGEVTFADAALAKRLLSNVQANMLGVVLNNSRDQSAKEYYNYYSYGDRTRRSVRKVFD